MKLKILLPLLCYALAGNFTWLNVAAVYADEVLLVPVRHGGPPVVRSGEIVDYTGLELKLETVGGRVEAIPVDRIEDIRAEWSAAHQTADGLLAEGRVEAAAASYREARKLERRRWVVRRITAQLVICYASLNSFETAGDEFLALAADDPQLLHLDVIPLPWRTLPMTKELDARARVWLTDSRTPVAPLLGASWLLGTNARETATAQLTKLANGKDKKLALLAEVQLWRTQVLTANQSDVERWEAIFNRLPDHSRPAACYILGDAWGRLSRPELAAEYYLQIPILYPQQRSAAADALVAAGKQMELTAQPTAALNLYREAVRRYPATSAAAAAKARLPAETSNPSSPAGTP